MLRTFLDSQMFSSSIVGCHSLFRSFSVCIRLLFSSLMKRSSRLFEALPAFGELIELEFVGCMRISQTCDLRVTFHALCKGCLICLTSFWIRLGWNGFERGGV